MDLRVPYLETLHTEAKRQERNEIKNNADVAIAQQNLEAAERTLEIDRKKQDATLSQQRDIANKTAATRAETAQKEAEAQRAEAEARITTEQTVALREAEAKQTKEQAQINANLAINQRRIEAERDTELAEQERAIAVANKSQQESQAKAEAEKARALAVSSEESVTTAREVEIGERARKLTVIAAKQEAERDATKITVAAEAERAAAENRATAVRVAAEAEAAAITTKAQAQATTYQVEAEGQEKINKARNTMSADLIAFELTRERLRIVPLALAEAVRPLEKIGDVKIIDMGGGAPARSGVVAGRSDALVDQLLAYQAQSPIVAALLKEAGFTKDGNVIRSLLGEVTAPAAGDTKANGAPNGSGVTAEATGETPAA